MQLLKGLYVLWTITYYKAGSINESAGYLYSSASMTVQLCNDKSMTDGEIENDNVCLLQILVLKTLK